MSPAGPASPAAADRLRRDNTGLVLRSLRDAGPASRAALAQRTGLAKATVGVIVRELAAAGAVREGRAARGPGDAAGRGSAPAGRPGRPVEVDGARTVALGLEVNVDYLAATALDLAGREVIRRIVPVPDGPPTPQALAALAAQCRRELAGDGRRLIGATVAVPGRIDPPRRRVLDAPNLHWPDGDVVAAVATALRLEPPEGAGSLGGAGAGHENGSGARVGLDNDANCAAAAEVAFGSARGTKHLLYLTGTVGLGAGSVVDGVVQRGAHGLAGEVGHAPLGDPTLTCGCGRSGCWETAVGLRALLRETGLGATGAVGDPLTVGRQVADACVLGHAQALAGVARVAGSLADGLATLAAALDPAVVVLGGFFVPLGPWLLPAVQARVCLTSPCRVVLSLLGLQAASTGAAAAVLADVYSGTLSLR
jgi:predicted NBD/HSP70 family sugar kinase